MERLKGRKSHEFSSPADVEEVNSVIRNDPDDENREETTEIPNENTDKGFSGLKVAVILAVIFGCFAAIYPRFLHPMVTSAVAGKSAHQRGVEDTFLPPKFKQGSVHPAMASRPKSNMHDRPTHHPGSRFTGEGGYVPESKGGLYFMLPIYTCGIIAFLMYTFYKVLNRPQLKSATRPTKPENIRYCTARQQFTATEPIASDIDRISSLLAGDRTNTRPVAGDRSDGVSDEDSVKITEFQLQALETKLRETEEQMSRLIAQMAVAKSMEDMVKRAEDSEGELEGDDEEEEEVDGEETANRLVPDEDSRGIRKESGISRDDNSEEELLESDSMDDDRDLPQGGGSTGRTEN